MSLILLTCVPFHAQWCKPFPGPHLCLRCNFPPDCTFLGFEPDLRLQKYTNTNKSNHLGVFFNPLRESRFECYLFVALQYVIPILFFQVPINLKSTSIRLSGWFLLTFCHRNRSEHSSPKTFSQLCPGLLSAFRQKS